MSQIKPRYRLMLTDLTVGDVLSLWQTVECVIGVRPGSEKPTQRMVAKLAREERRIWKDYWDKRHQNYLRRKKRRK